jgi:hypothetical protein
MFAGITEKTLCVHDAIGVGDAALAAIVANLLMSTLEFYTGRTEVDPRASVSWELLGRFSYRPHSHH